ALMEAGEFIRTIEKRQGLKIACPEEIALLQGWIDAADAHRLAEAYGKTAYGEYIRMVARAHHERR
ncbi:MAG: glucose-1-phosphate thymidylyltransferase, partial [Hyphomonadaceae bacterium]